jgi:hypothetical protein
MSKLLLNLVVLSLFLTSCQSKKQLFERLLNSANEDLAEHEYDKALKKINDAIHLEPDTVAGYLLRGRMLYLTKRFKESKIDFHRVLEFNNQSTAAFFYLGLNSAELDQLDSAILFYNKAYVIKGGKGLHFEINREGIAKYFTQDVELKAIVYYRGISYYYKGDYRNAYLDLSYAINENYNVGISYLYLGLMETDLDNSPLGCKYLKLAVENGEQEANKYLAERCR